MNLAEYFPIKSAWYCILQEEFKKNYMRRLAKFIESEQKNTTIYPKMSTVFKAFELTDINEVKVVIVGQDPYHGESQAQGLSFSVAKNVAIPPSLRNIFKEIQQEYPGVKHAHGDISEWAKQGVFLLNSVLTVRDKTPSSHVNQGWETFTDNVIRRISDTQHAVVFLLWGNYAEKKTDLVNQKKHYVLKAPHPSPLSAHRGFLGCKHFVDTNRYLAKHDKAPIEWATNMHAVSKKIIHVDMDAFFASVEQRDFPHLRDKPIAVGGLVEKRGVIAACSYEAREVGVRSAMASSKALELCPKLIIVKPRFAVYRTVSMQVHRVFSQYTKKIEPLSLDEAYLDVTEYAQRTGRSATKIAKIICEKIQETTDLTASAGVSFNKFLAKSATEVNKPNGIFVIKPEQAYDFVSQLTIRELYGVGKATEKKMQLLGLETVQDIRGCALKKLQKDFGRMGEYYYYIVRGIDYRKVNTNRVRKSLAKEITFEENITEKAIIKQKLQKIAEQLETKLRGESLVANTLTLKVKYADFNVITRSKTSEQGIVNIADIQKMLPSLLDKTQVGTRAVRLIGLSLSKLRWQTKAQQTLKSTEQKDLFHQNV